MIGASILDYELGVDLFGDYAIEKLQAAVDANDADLIHCPEGLVRLYDTLVQWRPIRWKGVSDEVFWHEFGDSTEGVIHPRVGTIWHAIGSGVGRQWSDYGNGEDDTSNTPMIAIIGEKFDIEGISLRMGIDGHPAWKEYIHICGSRGHRFDRFGAQGLGATGAARAFVVDGSWSKLNTNIIGTPENDHDDGDPAFAHVRQLIKDGKLKPDMMSAGPTDIHISERCAMAGVQTLVIQGRKGSFPYGANPYGPNGISDFRSFATLYNDGPLLDRMDHGGTVFIDYKLPSGKPVINGVAGNNGQNITIGGRIDPAAKYAAKVSHGHKVTFLPRYQETGTRYQSDVEAYNTAHAYDYGFVPYSPRAIIETDDTCTGEVAILSSGWFDTLKVGNSTPIRAREHVWRPAFGHLIHYEGYQNGEYSTAHGRSEGWEMTTPHEIYSGGTDGRIHFAHLLSSGKDSFTWFKRVASGKGAMSFDGVSWLDYGKDSYVPTLRGSSYAGSHSYSKQAGSYIRVGQLVSARGELQVVGSVDPLMSGNMQIGPLPFTSRNTNACVAGVVFSDINNANLSSGKILAGILYPNSNWITLSERGSSGDGTLTSASKFGSNFRVRYDITYEI